MICLKNLSLCKFRDVSGVRHFSELSVEIYNLKQYDIFTPDQDKSNSLKQPEKQDTETQGRLYVQGGEGARGQPRETGGESGTALSSRDAFWA